MKNSNVTINIPKRKSAGSPIRIGISFPTEMIKAKKGDRFALLVPGLVEGNLRVCLELVPQGETFGLDTDYRLYTPRIGKEKTHIGASIDEMLNKMGVHVMGHGHFSVPAIDAREVPGMEKAERFCFDIPKKYFHHSDKVDQKSVPDKAKNASESKRPAKQKPQKPAAVKHCDDYLVEVADVLEESAKELRDCAGQVGDIFKKVKEAISVLSNG